MTTTTTTKTKGSILDDLSRLWVLSETDPSLRASGTDSAARERLNKSARVALLLETEPDVTDEQRWQQIAVAASAWEEIEVKGLARFLDETK